MIFNYQIRDEMVEFIKNDTLKNYTNLKYFHINLKY